MQAGESEVGSFDWTPYRHERRTDPELQRRDWILVALKRAIEQTFDKSRWIELGHLTHSTELLENHHRLYRSLAWGDDDYGACILEVLPGVLGENFEHRATVEEFVGLKAWLEVNDRPLYEKLYGGVVQLRTEDLSALSDPGAIEDHLRRIQSSVATDPAHAIGAAKELVESTAKLVLRALGQAVDERADVGALVREVQVALALHPNSLAPTQRGVDSVKRILGGLSAIAIGVAELRNVYGTGHGRSERVPGLGPRHAQLAVDAASTYCRTLLATLADEDAPWRRRVR